MQSLTKKSNKGQKNKATISNTLKKLLEKLTVKSINFPFHYF